MKYIYLVFFVLSFTEIQAQNIESYKIYTKEGKESSFQQMLETCGDAEVVLFGELHNISIVHWLQLKTTEALYALKNGQISLGAEMLETDNQLLLDEYLQGHIQTRHFEKEARLWNNYKTDYKPLVEFAKSNKLPFIATNIPRRYASKVFAEGLPSLDSLSKTAQGYIAPRPVQVDLELPGYKALLNMAADGHGGVNFPHAQAIKDATMGHFIVQNLQKERLFLHFNGSYHSDNFEGIGWYLNHYRPNTKTKTISTVLQRDINTLLEAHIGKADFIICVPEDMTTTY